MEAGRRVIGVEVKSGATLASGFFAGLLALAERLAGAGAAEEIALRLVFGGDLAQRRSGADAVTWRDVQEHAWH